MEVAAWLRDLGLDCYVEAFADNDIDEGVLPRLTADDLVAIGVKSIGHRRKLIVAIAALSMADPAQVAAPVRAPSDAERRQLSVLYGEIDGAAISRLSAEDVRTAIQAFHRVSTDAVAEFDGHVANFYGDRMLAYFGWPRAHEDDAERAAYAGLKMADPGPRPGSWGSLRVGIATGEVVVGDLIREGPAREQSAVGLTPNLAARLLGLADPGQVVIDRLTLQLLPSNFTVQALGEHALKGIRDPVPAYVIQHERPADSRFDARRGRELAPMIGRDQELALLLSRWAQVRSGEGCAVLLEGEAGIGKSRLARAMLDAVTDEPHALVRWQCSPHHTGSALWPVIEQLKRAFGLKPQDSAEQALDKLEALTGYRRETSALYATLLGLSGTQRYGSLEMSPLVLRERTLEVLAEQLGEIAHEQGLLLLVEDVHWIDPTTLELLKRLLEHIERARQLIVITSRPEEEPKLGWHSNVTRLSISRLGRASVEALVARLSGGKLEPRTLARIASQTDGVPLFVEELTKAVLETGEAAIPAPLHGALMARLDRIPEAREVAQTAACVGREVDLALLLKVMDAPERVASALERLVAAELMFRRGSRDSPRYIFKHALVQEAAYESLLRDKRRRVHARILEVLEATAPDPAPEMLAHHATHAELADKAIACWLRAGNAAMATSAHFEAIGFFERAIGLLQLQAVSADRSVWALQLQMRLAEAHLAGMGFGAQATKKVFLRAQELLESQPGKLYVSRLYYGLWAWYAARGELRGALRVAQRARARARADRAGEGLLEALRLTAGAYLYLGEFRRARHCLEQALPILDAPQGEGSGQFVVDHGVAVCFYFAWLLYIEGYADQSHQMIARASSLALRATGIHEQAMARLYRFIHETLTRDRMATMAAADAFTSFVIKQRLHMFGGGAAEIVPGWIAIEQGGFGDEELNSFERGVRKLERPETHLYLPLYMTQLAIGQLARGRSDAALQTVERALGCESAGWCDAELWRVRGEAFLGGVHPDAANARRSFEQALHLARARGARLWELRAATSMAHWMAAGGDEAGARDLLARVCGGFTEGHSTPEMVKAQELMAALGASSTQSQ